MRPRGQQWLVTAGPPARPIAALYVDPRGFYAGRTDVEIWDEVADGRLYAGPYPVVAHPPCSRWCRLAGLVEARWGHRRGDDGACFAHALGAVRSWGGVLEHPAYSDAWEAFGLPAPNRLGGWSEPDAYGGRSAHVEQFRYGHPAKKATWLYAVGVAWSELRWGSVPDSVRGGFDWDKRRPRALVSWCGNHVKSGEKRPRVGKRVASATPDEFGELLIGMARSASKPAAAVDVRDRGAA